MGSDATCNPLKRCCCCNSLRFGALLAAAFYFAVAAATIVVATVGTRHRIATQGVRTAPRPARLRIDLLPLLPPKRLRA
jgi:hypothetical protein